MKPLMIQGTTSGAGKTTLVAALCRIFSDKGYSVAPFKSQNMSNLVYSTPDFRISRAQAIQAIAARCPIVPDLNPILLNPLGNYRSAIFLNGKFYRKMIAKNYYENFVRPKGLQVATNSLSKLQKSFDLVIIEGAGSPAEINLQKYDIANMAIAKKANASVLLVSDIDRGGSFASLAGTLMLIEKKHQKFVKGFVLNKFRGDIDVLTPGFRKLRRITNRPILGTIPMIRMGIPEEDSLDVKPKKFSWTKRSISKMDKEIEYLSQVVRDNLDVAAIERMIK